MAPLWQKDWILGHTWGSPFTWHTKARRVLAIGLTSGTVKWFALTFLQQSAQGTQLLISFLGLMSTCYMDK